MVKWRSSENFAASAVERLAVLEFHARPQLDRDLLAVGGGLVRQRELRHDVELFVDVEQLVAERREHDAADIGARQRRVENVRIFGKADAQRGLGVNTCLKRQQQRRRDSRQTQDFHWTGLHLLESPGCRRYCPDYINPGGAGYFPVAAEGRHQPFQRRRKAAVGEQMASAGGSSAVR